jgi:hypothetical protein
VVTHRFTWYVYRREKLCGCNSRQTSLDATPKLLEESYKQKKVQITNSGGDDDHSFCKERLCLIWNMKAHYHVHNSLPVAYIEPAQRYPVYLQSILIISTTARIIFPALTTIVTLSDEYKL